MYQNISQHDALKKLVKKIFNDSDLEVLKRPQSVIIKRKEEGGDKVTRIILLQPKGYSSNKVDELSSHDEVRKAKISIKGILKSEKDNFSIIKNCLRFAYLTTRHASTEINVPYAFISDNTDIYKEKVFSSKDTVYVVKENGEGFYHNLINLSDNWLVLVLEKELHSGKEMNINSKITKLTISEKKLVLDLIKKIEKYGDELFIKETTLIKKILKLETKKLIPILIEALNIYETGRHEPCTVYALILKRAKVDDLNTLELLRASFRNKEAPLYYLAELIEKIGKKRS